MDEKAVASSLPGEVAPETKGPTPEEQFKAWVVATTQRLEKLEKDNAQNREVMVKVDEGLAALNPMVKEWQASKGQTQGGKGGWGDIMEIVKQGRSILGGGTGDEDTYAAIGHRVMDGVLDTTVKKVVRELGGETAHVVLKE